jgi:Tfp pilus assembly protein PilX
LIRKSLLVYALGAIVLLALASFQSHIDTERAETAEAQLEVAETGAQAALSLADRAIAVAKDLSDSADVYEHSRDSLRLRGDSLERRVANLHSRFSQLAATAPDTCSAVVAAAVVTIDSLTELAETRKAQAASAENEALSYRFALDTTQKALNSARLSLGALGKAADAVERASRPSLLSRILPRPGYGATAGIDAFGKPNAVVGITLSWNF